MLEAAKRLDINVWQTCEQHLRELVRREQERQGRLEHADFVAAYDTTVDTEGLPLAEWKGF